MDPAGIIEHLPLGRGVSVIEAHPEGLVALEKPFRVLSHPNCKEERTRSLLTCPWSSQKQCYLWNEGEGSFQFDLLHRLDSPTSGVILGCVNPAMTEILKEQFSSRKVSKSYLAVVAGLSREKRYHWKDFMRRTRVGPGIRTEISSSGGRRAEALAETLLTKSSPPQMSLLKLRPLTGRTHQLRLQCAQRKLPILGDKIYGDFQLNRRIRKNFKPSRLFLHAASIHIRWIWKGKEHNFQAHSPIPPEFEIVLGKKGVKRKI